MSAEKNGKQQPSKETLQKVQQMKKKVESTISGRINHVNQRRLRSLKMHHKIKDLNIDEEKKKDYMSEYYNAERNVLRKQRQIMGLKDFSLVKVIGKGAFGEVRIVRDKHKHMPYAMKTMRKKDMVAKNQVTHVQAEKDLMAAADNPWLVKLHFSFQDDTYLYLVMEYCGGGDLMTILMREDILTENQTKFYMAELAAAISAVHDLEFVHRDLKPDNILIANNGHIKLSDFGLAKSFNVGNDDVISKYQQNAHTLKDSNKDIVPTGSKKHRRDRKLMYSTVGTPDYIAPEVFSQKGYDTMVDWWSMGVIMFECLVGYPPFYAEDPLQTCRKIVHYRKYFKIPHDAKLSREGVDLIHNLVCSHRRRYTFEQIRNHAFFKSVPFDNLMAMKPPFVPQLKTDVDASNFDAIEAEQNDMNADTKFKPSKSTDKTHFWGYTFKRGVNMNSPEIEQMMKKMEKQYQEQEQTTEEDGDSKNNNNDTNTNNNKTNNNTSSNGNGNGSSSNGSSSNGSGSSSSKKEEKKKLAAAKEQKKSNGHQNGSSSSSGSSSSGGKKAPNKPLPSSAGASKNEKK